MATNRSREFLNNELNPVDGGRWKPLFETTVCADEVDHYKPFPDIISQALKNLGASAASDIWYIGDSASDMVTAANAGVTSIFYNGGLWEDDRIDQMFL